MSRAVLATIAALLLGACVNIAPGSTVPPIKVPTFPPINLPSGITLPSVPPIVIPSGVIPGGSGTCTFVSAQEMAAIFGSAPVFTDDSSGGCAMTLSSGVTVTISVDKDADLQSSRILMGDTARDITVGGLPGLTGVIVLVPTVQVQRGNDQLQVVGIALSSDDAFMSKLVQVATVAVSHWP